MEKSNKCHQLMLFAEASLDLVSRSPLLAKRKEKKTTDIYGLKCSELLESSSPIGLLRKMLMGSSIWDYQTYSMTWKAKDLNHKHLLFQLARSAHRTKENESGLWLTPSATIAEQVQYGSPVKSMFPTPTAQDFKKRGPNSSQQGLSTFFRTPDANATRGMRKIETIQERQGKGMHLNLNDQIKLFSTPSARDYKGQTSQNWNHETLPDQVGGQLNPNFVEWMMGFPENWTQI